MTTPPGGDHDLDRILDSLRSVEIPADLESRVMLGLHQHTSASGPTPLRLPGAAAAFACVLAIAVAGALVVHRQTASAPGRTQHSARTMSPDAAARSAEMTQAVVVASHVVTPVRSRQGSQPPATPQRGMPATAELSEDARARAEMLAPSMPEQPTPLTRQERLLLRVAASRSAPELAATSLDTHATEREQLSQLGQGISRGLPASKHEPYQDQETE
jgi:hypothetical protein